MKNLTKCQKKIFKFCLLDVRVALALFYFQHDHAEKWYPLEYSLANSYYATYLYSAG